MELSGILNEKTLPWLVTALVLLLMVVRWLLKRPPRSLAQKINLTLLREKFSNETDVILPDGMGGVLDIARIVQVPQGIVVIESLEAEGRVFGAEKIDLWAQILNGRSVKFDNPLYGLAEIEQVVKNVIPGVPVHGLIVLDERAVFEKSMPDGVTTLANLPMMLATLPQQKLTADRCDQAWQRIRRIARKDGKALSAAQ